MEIVYNMTLHVECLHVECLFRVQIAAWRKAFDMSKDHISTIEQSRHDQHIENLENQRRDWGSNPGQGSLKADALFWDHLYAVKAFDIWNDHISTIEQS